MYNVGGSYYICTKKFNQSLKVKPWYKYLSFFTNKNVDYPNSSGYQIASLNSTSSVIEDEPKRAE